MGRLVARSVAAPTHRHGRAVIALCRRRLNGRFGARLSWVLGVAGVLVALGLVVMGGEALGTREIIVRGVRWLAWLAAPPIALAAAGAPAERDRADGVDVLMGMHGVSDLRLATARGLAAMIEVSYRLGLPAVALCLSVVMATGAWPLLGMLPGLVLFAGWGGMVLGGLGAGCGYFGGARGRSLLLAVVLVPWVIADAWGVPGLSIPGVVDMMLTLFADVTSFGARLP